MEYNSHCCFFGHVSEKIPAEPLNSQKVDLLKYIVHPLENISLIGMSSFPVKDCSVLRSSSWEGSFIVLYLLWYGASVNTVCHKDQPVETLHRPNASTHRNLSWDELTWWSRLIRFYIIPSHDKPGVWFTPGPHGKTRKEKIISRRWLRKKDVLWDVRKTVSST